MSDSSGIHAVLLVTPKGQIIHERFMAPVDATQVSQLKLGVVDLLAVSAHDLTRGDLQLGTLPYWDAPCPVVFRRVNDVVFLVVGGSTQLPVDLESSLENIVAGLLMVISGSRLGEASLFEAYDKVAMVVEEVLGGIGRGVEQIPPEMIRDAILFSDINHKMKR